MAFQTNIAFNRIWGEMFEITVNETNKPTIKSLLDGAVALDYDEPIHFFNVIKSSSLVCRLIQITRIFEVDSSERKQIYDLIVCVTSKQKICVSITTVNSVLKSLEAHWFILLHTSESSNCTVLISLMEAISAVSYGNGAHIHPGVLDWLVKLDNAEKSFASLTIQTENFNIRKIGLQCLKGLCIVSSNQERLEETKLLSCCKVFFHILQLDSSKTESPRYNLVFTAMRGIKNVFEIGGNKKVENLDNVFISLKKAASFGRQLAGDQPTTPLLQQLGDISISSSSESEFSDSELVRDPNQKKFAAKFRQLALDCLLSIVRKTSKNNLFSYWNLLFHEGSVTLLSCLKCDPLPKVRSTAAMATTNLLESGKPYLALTIQTAKRDNTFISFSSKMAASVCEIHNILINCLDTEPCMSVRGHILKAISALCATSPYGKLNHGLISDVACVVRLKLADDRLAPNTQIAALGVFMALLNNNSTSDEIIDCFKIAHNGVFLKSWLVEFCIKLYNDNSSTYTPRPLAIAALQTLTATTKSYFQLLTGYIDELLKITRFGLSQSNLCFSLHVCKLVEGLGKGLAVEARKSPQCADLTLRFWKELLQGCLPQLVSNCDSSVASQVCDILSIVGSSVYQKLSSSEQQFCVTSLLKFVVDENYLVRSSSIRCLAVYITYPLLRNDDVFIRHVAEGVLNLVLDPIKSVQSNAAWAFANLTDSLVANKESNDGEDSGVSHAEPISDELLRKLFEIALKLTSGKDKVRFNLMRILGNLLRILNAKHAEDGRLIKFVATAKQVLITSLQTDKLMKVRWNACMALGNYLHNSNLPIGNPVWSADVYQCLSNTLVESKNFKVKIKACLALCCVGARAQFGDSFHQVYLTVFDEMKDEQVQIPATEYRFEDKLQVQLLFTILHLNQLAWSDADLHYIVEKMRPKVRNLAYIKILMTFAKEEVTKELTEPAAASARKEMDENNYAITSLSPSEKLVVLENAATNWKKKFDGNDDDKQIHCLFDKE